MGRYSGESVRAPYYDYPRVRMAVSSRRLRRQACQVVGVPRRADVPRLASLVKWCSGLRLRRMAVSRTIAQRVNVLRRRTTNEPMRPNVHLGASEASACRVTGVR